LLLLERGQDSAGLGLGEETGMLGVVDRLGLVDQHDRDVVTHRVPTADTAKVTARLLAEQDVLDLNVEDPPIEDVIELVFAQESVE